MYYSSEYESPIGRLLLVCDADSLVGLWMEGQRYYCASLHDAVVVSGETSVTKQVFAWLDSYFEGRKPVLSIPMSPIGTDFQRDVWRMLQDIPYGTVTSYGTMAHRLSEKTGRCVSAQAVGGAVGRNPIAIIVPCHRVLGANGSLTGYAGGLEKKKALLALEGITFSFSNR